MGSLAVLTMAEDVSRSDCPGRRPLHPFFAPNRVAAPTLPTDRTEVNDAPEVNENPPSPTGTTGEDKPSVSTSENHIGQQNKRRKTAHGDQDGDDEQKKTRPKKRARPSTGGGIANHFKKLGADTSDAANKHDSTAKGDSETSPPRGEPETDVPTQKDQDHPAAEPKHGASPVAVTGSESSSHPQLQTTSSAADLDTAKPKKLLFQFNLKRGTIGSAPRKKPSQVAGGRSAAHESKATPKVEKKAMSRVICIRYGTDEASRIRIGERINDILGDQMPGLTTPTRSSQPSGQGGDRRRAVTKPATPKRSKTTHPFFLGNAKKAEVVISSEGAKPNAATRSPAKMEMKQFSSTPCSPKKPRVDTSNIRLPQFGVKNAGLKFPGSKLPAWPWKDLVHVRGDEPRMENAQGFSQILPFRKSKGHAVKVLGFESVLESVALELDIPKVLETVRNTNTDDFLPAPPELRLPQKHFESGRKLQARILPELESIKSSLAAVQHKQLITGKEAGIHLPSQLARLFDSVSSGLSAFDQSQCETANWVQKYAPISAVEVLQHGQEPFMLRDWLQALMVQSVDTGQADTDQSKAVSAKRKTAGTGKKKRRKRLDGFIVSSDDEDYELYPLSDDEADWAPSGSRGIVRKTVVRSSDLSKSREGEKIANTLVISGPHGCGKTAAVYAVAKELGFEVFEINPSSRRSGRDVLEKIGDMTRNHLVRQNPSAAQALDQETPATEDETAKDLESGKQSTMNAFFKPKPDTAKLKALPKSSLPGQQKEAKKESSRRQSLILLEEADILYEEDKQFWATVIGLIAQSKRPFVVTCNDETLLPLQSLRLHGIFRLTPPPRELAIDRLILVAANEGHALKRRAVESLYESRHQDLRAATMDLQYWCQMGVGDRRGGFDWFYARWPKGIDQDENGEVVRVISEGTYNTGMNWLGRDSIIDSDVSPRLIEEELLLQSWDSWALDIGHWQDSNGFPSWAEGVDASAAAPPARLDTLNAFGDLAESMSAADMSACKSFATFKEEPLDVTLPDLPAKARDDFILGLTHLDAPYATQYSSSPALIATTMKSLAKSSLQAHTQARNAGPRSELQPLTESRAISRIERNLTTPAPGTTAISRLDYAFAFDPIAVSDSSPLQPVSYLDPSLFDRTFKLIALDVAPYVRSIVAYDSKLQKQRLQLSTLMSEGGKAARGSKRMRTTRAALSALEGGSRSTTRGEKWFKADINPHLVMRTAGEGWTELCDDVCDKQAGTPTSNSAASPKLSPASSPISSPSPRQTPKKAARRGRPRKKVVDDDSADELGDEGETSRM